MSVADVIYAEGLVPVLKIRRAEDAVPLCRALLAGGLSTAEITFRTEAAAEAIARVSAELPRMTVGAGTITSLEQARAALSAGARFLVAPGFNPELVGHFIQEGVPIYPGCATASEVDAAIRLGLSVVKFFPAEQSGGLAAIKALSGPFPGVRFMPTGGIGLNNLGSYLASPQVFACGGSFMAPDDLITQGRWDGISALARESSAAAQGFELAHVGLHAANADEALDLAELLSTLTGLPVKEGRSSFFVGGDVELVKGVSGDFSAHLAYGVLNVERGARYLGAKGFDIDEASVKRGADGRMTSVYLKRRLNGFGLHLTARKV